MLMAWLTVVFNIMISNPQKIDYITSSLFTRWKKIYCPAVLWDKHKVRENNTVLMWAEQGLRCIKAAIYGFGKENGLIEM